MTCYRTATTWLAFGIFVAFATGYAAAAGSDPTSRAVFIFLLSLYLLVVGWLGHKESTKP
jgi:hypothetical protein